MTIKQEGSHIRVVVTGATGFVGKPLVKALSQHHEMHVFALSRNIDKALKIFPPKDYGNVSIVEADDWETLKEISPNYVIHLAALSTSRDDSEIIAPLIESNVTYGVKLLKSLSETSTLKMLINIGSFAEYRNGNDKKDYAYLYAATKGAFEPFLEYYSNKSGFKYLTAVFYSIYGGDMTVKRIMDYIVDSLNAEEPINMTSGNQALDFVHINDIVSFLIYCLRNDDKFSNGGIYHIGTGQTTTIRELASIVENISGKKSNINWGARPYRERDIMYACAPIDQTTKLTGWSPTIDLQTGVKQYLKQIYR